VKRKKKKKIPEIRRNGSRTKSKGRKELVKAKGKGKRAKRKPYLFEIAEMERALAYIHLLIFFKALIQIKVT
jgi:hypothetical protein